MQWNPEDAAVRRFLENGWEEVDTLGRGARGPVVSIRRSDGAGPICALKRSSHHEVQALKALAVCRNIVELQETFLSSGQVLARLECMEGGSFRSYLRARPPGRVSEDVVRYVVGQVLEGLQDVHRERWMHRDVKAENIGLSCELSGWGYRDCRVKLLDFDVAVEIPSWGRLTEVIGTVENMAPEVFKGAYNELADIWSVGVITYEALYGYRPFNDANVDRVEEMVRNWQRYLLFPFDAAELPSNFIRLMLADPEERGSASTIRSHRWLRPGHIESPLPATGSGFPTSSYRHHATSKSDGTKFDKHEAACRSRSVKVSPVKLLGEAEDEVETSFGWEQVDSPSGQDVETLSRLRQGLSMWTNSRFSLMDPPAPPVPPPPDKGQEKGQEGAAIRLGRFIPVGSPLSGTEIRMPDRSKVAGERARTLTLDSLEEVDITASLEEAAKAEKADKWHQSYLQRVRDRTKEVLKAAQELKVPKEAPVERPPPAPLAPVAPVAPVAVPERQRRPLEDDDLNTDSWQRQKSDDTEVRHSHNGFDGFPRQLSPSQSLPHVPYLHAENPPAEPATDVSLQHLKSTQSRAQELLQILSQASRTPRRSKEPAQAQVEGCGGFMPTPPPRPPVNPAPRRPTPLAPDRVVAAIASAVDTGSNTAEGSPLSWLACQKHRMDRLLLGLQSASEDVAVVSGS